MPKIEEYLPQSVSEGPVGGVSPRTDEIDKLGRGIEQSGAALEDAGDALSRRQKMAEESEGSMMVSELRAQKTAQAEDQIRKGTIDSDQFLQQYDQDAQALRDKLSTPGAQNYFDRINGRVKAAMTIKVIRGAQDVAGNNAVAAYKDSANNDQQTVQTDPNQFESTKAQTYDKIQTLVDSGALPASQQGKFTAQAMKDLATAAAHGLADMDQRAALEQVDKAINDPRLGPNYIPNKRAIQANIESFSSAANAVGRGTTKDENGNDIPTTSAFLDKDGNEILDSKDKESILTYQRKTQAETLAEIGRRVTERQSQISDYQKNFINTNYNSIVTGKVPIQQISKDPKLTAESKDYLINLAEKGKETFATNPKVFNDIQSRINAPPNDPKKIDDPYDITKYIGHGLSSKDATTLIDMNKETEEGQNLKTNRAMLIKIAQARLVNPKSIGGSDPDGEYHLQQFTQELQQAEAAKRAAGLPVRDLYDTKSKDYLGNQIDKYLRSSQDVMESKLNQFYGNQGPQTMSGPAKPQPNPTPQQAAGYGIPLPQPPMNAPAHTQEKMIKVISPSGQSGTLSEELFNKYTAQGKKYQRVNK